jgi:hypothetical protein
MPEIAPLTAENYSCFYMSFMSLNFFMFFSSFK